MTSPDSTPTPSTTPATAPGAPTVRRADPRHRYEVLVDEKTAGFTAYRDREQQRVFFHTEIDDAFAGQGLASILVREALTDVRAAGLRLVPICPYVAKFLQKHREFDDITDPVTDEIRTWLDATLAR
ncbi:GNAT family N-acetyltransferase [Streptomyces sp. SYP-A7185]|uniref:GNAT family N-acetyltransferase n=1 Tax=Streptomyces sp. SYP-A7185 TaxID=3040076 RepID=UPI0038F61951